MSEMTGPPEVSFARRTVAWTLGSALALSLLALGVDAILVVCRVRLRASTMGAGFAEGATLVAVVSLLAGPLAAGLELVCRSIATAGPRWRRLWPAPLALLAAGWALVVSGLSLYGRAGGNLVVVAGFGATIAVVAVAAQARRRGASVAVLLAVLVATLAINVRFAWLRPDHQDLLDVASLCALQGLLTPLRRRLRTTGTRVLAGAMAVIVASCTLDRLPAEDTLSRWRRRSDEHARFQPSLRRSLRALWDLDLDGYSPIFGGGDCDDTTATRNPGRSQRAGGVDDNCNDVVPPAEPTPADRGLAPPFGAPAPPGGPLDLVVLISVDCMRADVLTPDVTPTMWSLGARGAWMTAMHAAGTKTAHSLPYLQRPYAATETVATRLAQSGITSTAVVAIGVGVPDLLAGFDHEHMPRDGERWTAHAATELALADLKERRGPHYLWVHYYDAHQDLESLPGDVDRGPIPGAYLREMTGIDRELQRIVDVVDPARTAIIVTADHGEAFGEHGIPFHAATPYEPLIHVPGIFVAPGVAAGRYGGLVSHRDVPVTTLAAFGVDVSGVEQFGRSWFRLRDAGGAPLHTFVVSSGSSSGIDEPREWAIGALVEPERKLIERYDVRYFMLFDPTADPGEDDDLSDAEPQTTARLRRELAVYRDLDPAR